MRVDVNHLLQQALNASALRQKVIANNVANANTPGFKRSFVSFEEFLRDATVAGRDVRKVSPRVIVDGRTTMREDGNNVDIDHEMVLMSANEIHNRALTSQLNERLALKRYVINGGR